MILDKFYENGEIFLLFDSGEHDVDKIFVFGIETGLDLVKYKDCHGTYKCGTDMYYFTYTFIYVT